jgi:peptidoglycan hydrolase CwlO-like protein
MRLSLYLALIFVSLLATGCVATTGDLEKLKQELNGDAKTKFDSVHSDTNKVMASVMDLQGRVNELNAKAEQLVRERDKIQAFLESANRRILALFKSEEHVLKNRMEFLRAAVKEFEVEDQIKKADAAVTGTATAGK